MKSFLSQEGGAQPTTKVSARLLEEVLDRQW